MLPKSEAIFEARTCTDGELFKGTEFGETVHWWRPADLSSVLSRFDCQKNE